MSSCRPSKPQDDRSEREPHTCRIARRSTHSGGLHCDDPTRYRRHQRVRSGFHLVTSEIVSQLPKLPKTGIVTIFTKHTSCGLSINENCDPDVRIDMETIFNRLVPENRPEYEHTLEGADDMPAHAKSTLSGVSITIPITDGRLNLGTWQGIYFCEYRNYGGSRELVVTIIGE